MCTNPFTGKVSHFFVVLCPSFSSLSELLKDFVSFLSKSGKQKCDSNCRELVFYEIELYKILFNCTWICWIVQYFVELYKILLNCTWIWWIVQKIERYQSNLEKPTLQYTKCCVGMFIVYFGPLWWTVLFTISPKRDMKIKWLLKNRPETRNVSSFFFSPLLYLVFSRETLQ